MKEATKFHQDKLEISATAPIKTEKVLLGKLRPKPGQKVFRLNLLTAAIDEPEMEAMITTNGKVIKNIRQEHACVYVVALNRANAEKKFIKALENL